MAQSGKNTSQQVISLSGPICFHPHGSLPWGPHGFPCVLHQCTNCGAPNASRWEQQLERLAGKNQLLGGSCLRECKYSHRKSKGRMEAWKEVTALSQGQEWSAPGEEEKQQLLWIFRMCRDPKNKPTVELSVHLFFSKASLSCLQASF